MTHADQHAAFLHAIQDAPQDFTRYGEFADWLDEFCPELDHRAYAYRWCARWSVTPLVGSVATRGGRTIPWYWWLRSPRPRPPRVVNPWQAWLPSQIYDLLPPARTNAAVVSPAHTGGNTHAVAIRRLAIALARLKGLVSL